MRATCGCTIEVAEPAYEVEVTQPTYSVDIETGILEILPPYTGSYEVTPSEVAQTLPTAGAGMEQDIVVNPIPSNYGLITWNGSTITVS